MYRGEPGMNTYKYEFYAENNNCYAGRFVSERSPKEQGKIAYYLKLLEQRGPRLTEPYAEKVGEHIYELKPVFWNTEMRLFYFWDGLTAVFVHAIVKKKMKVTADIRLAEDRRKRYFGGA